MCEVDWHTPQLETVAKTVPGPGQVREWHERQKSPGATIKHVHQASRIEVNVRLTVNIISSSKIKTGSALLIPRFRVKYNAHWL